VCQNKLYGTGYHDKKCGKHGRNPMNGKTIEWLLEKENPSVRYFTLTELLGTPEDSDEVMAVKKEIMNSGMVPGILEHQHLEGYWETGELL
jgi:hypothetical protein